MRNRKSYPDGKLIAMPQRLPHDLADDKDARHRADLGELLKPAYWLVAALEEPEFDGPGESAIAVAPTATDRNPLGLDACKLLGCADIYHARHNVSVVFFSDLEHLITTAGTSWADLGVDGGHALSDLREASVPAMYFSLTPRARHLIGGTVTQARPSGADGPERIARERDVLRRAIAGKLAVDWLFYADRIIRADELVTSTP